MIERLDPQIFADINFIREPEAAPLPSNAGYQSLSVDAARAVLAFFWPTGSDQVDLIVKCVVQLPAVGGSFVPASELATRLRGADREEVLASLLEASELTTWLAGQTGHWHLGPLPSWAPVGYNAGETSELTLAPSLMDGRSAPIELNCKVLTGWVQPTLGLPVLQAALRFSIEVSFSLRNLDRQRQQPAIRRWYVGHDHTSIGNGDTGHTHSVLPDGTIDCEECGVASHLAVVDIDHPLPAPPLGWAPPPPPPVLPAALSLDETSALLVAIMVAADLARDAYGPLLSEPAPNSGYLGLWLHTMRQGLDNVIDMSEFRKIPGGGAAGQESVFEPLPLSDSGPGSLASRSAREGLARELLEQTLERAGRR